MSYPESLQPGESHVVHDADGHRITIVNGTAPPRVGLHVLHEFPDDGPGESSTAYPVSTLAEAIAIAESLI